MAAPADSPLLRRLSLPLLTFYGLGNILGAGIYVLIGEIAGFAGLQAPIAFLVAALVAAFTALSYAELGARYPVSAGEAVYISEGLGTHWLPLAVGLLIMLMGAVSAATISRGFIGYFQVLLSAPDALIITLLVALLAGVAIWGILASVRLAAALTLIEITGLLLVIYIGLPALAELPARWPALIPQAIPAVWHGILFSAFLAFYAFIGFEDMVNVAEEVRRPERTLPLAIIAALVIATLLYMLVALVAVLSVPPEVLAASDAPLATVYSQHSGERAVMLSVISMLAVVNGALIQIIMGSRILYGMARKGWLPDWLSRVHPRTHTPVRATLVVALIVWLLALFLPLLTLAQLTSLFVLVVFILVNLSLWRIKGRPGGPARAGILRLPRWTAMAGVVLSCALVGYQVIQWVGQ